MAFAVPANFSELANQRYEESRKFWRNWRTGARDDFAFVAGEQWLADDEALLKEQKRPPITFNYSEKMIDAVVGAEVSNRQEITYRPREPSDSGLADLWTAAANWARDEGDHEDEETDAFRDALICGMGWTLTRMEYETDIDGMIGCGRIDPLEMYSDPSAVKPSLVDRRYNFRNWWVDERIAKKRWPKAITFAVDEANLAIDRTSRTGQGYTEDSADEIEQHKGQVQIRHYECVENEPVYRIEPQPGNVIEMSVEDFNDVKEALEEAGIEYVKQTRRVFYYGFFAGKTLVEGGKSPCQSGFCYQAITGKRDRNRATWYGLTRVMKDPQRWANKWLSQILHIINSNAKGGVLAEVGAFVDSNKAQEDYAKPDSIVFLKEGALSGNKIKEKAMVQYPQGLDRLMEFALASLPQVTGINLEALGLAGREQANVLEQSRKQAAYGLLAPIFDSLRRYRKNQGRILLYFIHTYISDGRLIRIGGPESQQFIPLTKAQKAPTMDIIVDQSPNAPDVKSKTWDTLQVILPNMMKAGLPIPPDVLDYVPVPAAMAMKWKQYIQQNPPMDQKQAEKIQQEAEKAQEENQKLQMQLRDKTQELQLKIEEAKAELQMKDAEMKAKLQLQQIELQGKLQIERQKADNDMALKREKNEADIETQRVAVEKSGQNEAQSNVMGAINELIGIIGKIDADSKKDD
jgi:hypothetical protein